MNNANSTAIKYAVVINRSPSEVFNFVTDFRNDTRWWKPVIRTEKVTDGDIMQGTKFIQYSKVMFVTIQGHLQVIEWNPPLWVKYRNESPQLPYDLLYKFDAFEGKTRFSLEADMQMRGVLKVLKPITMWILHRQLKKYFWLLKEVMEHISYR